MFQETTAINAKGSNCLGVTNLALQKICNQQASGATETTTFIVASGVPDKWSIQHFEDSLLIQH